MQTRFPSGPPGRGTTTLHTAGSSTNFREYQALPVQPRFPSLTSEDRVRVGVRVALTRNKLRDPPAEHQIACFRNRCTAHDARTPPRLGARRPAPRRRSPSPLVRGSFHQPAGDACHREGCGQRSALLTPRPLRRGQMAATNRTRASFRALAPHAGPDIDLARETITSGRIDPAHPSSSAEHCTNRCPRAPPARPLTCSRPLDLPAFTAPSGVCQVEGSNREKWGARLNQLSAAPDARLRRRHAGSYVRCAIAAGRGGVWP